MATVLSVLAPVLSSSGLALDLVIMRRNYGLGPAKIVQHVAEITAGLRMGKMDYEPGKSGEPDQVAYVQIVRVGDFETFGNTRSNETIGISEVSENNPQLTLTSNSSPAYFIVGYGANRRSERPEGYSEKPRSPRYRRVAGLFEEQAGLAPFTYAYLQIKDAGRLNDATNILNSILPDSIDLTDDIDSQKRPLFKWKDIKLPLNALSDGYRTFISWVWDLLLQISAVIPRNEASLTNLLGVVIVDEIDLFLHPEWQRLVIQQVATAFPNLQFMFSSHSPLVAGTLEPANIYVLDGGKVEQYQENIYGLTANQVLTSSYFGLTSTRAPGTGTLADLANRMNAGSATETLPGGRETASPLITPETREIFREIARRQRGSESKRVKSPAAGDKAKKSAR
jgi:hypothetical protein